MDADRVCVFGTDLSGITKAHDVQRQTAVAAYLKSRELLTFAFVQQEAVAAYISSEQFPMHVGVVAHMWKIILHNLTLAN